MMTNKILARFYIAIITGILTFGVTQKYLHVTAYYLNGDEITSEDYDSYNKEYNDDISRSAKDGVYLYKGDKPDYKNVLLYSCVATFVAGAALLLPTAIRNKS